LPSSHAQTNLKSHKLKGKLAGSWACSAGDDLRVVFQFVKQGGQEAILLETMGTHDEVYWSLFENWFQVVDYQSYRWCRARLPFSISSDDYGLYHVFNSCFIRQWSMGWFRF